MGKTIWITADFSWRTKGNQKEMAQYFLSAEKNNCQPTVDKTILEDWQGNKDILRKRETKRTFLLVDLALMKGRKKFSKEKITEGLALQKGKKKKKRNFKKPQRRGGVGRYKDCHSSWVS